MPFFFVLGHTGAHEPAHLLSFWSSRELAEAEIERLKAAGSDFHHEIEEIEMDAPAKADQWGYFSGVN